MDKAEFAKLKAKWDAKLKKSGFKDIETKGGDLVNTSTSGGPIDPRRLNWQEAEEFFRLARYFLNDHQFKNSHERHLWSLYCECGSKRHCVELNNADKRRKKTDRQSCWEILTALEEEMKKMYGVSK